MILIDYLRDRYLAAEEVLIAILEFFTLFKPLNKLN